MISSIHHSSSAQLRISNAGTAIRDARIHNKLSRSQFWRSLGTIWKLLLLASFTLVRLHGADLIQDNFSDGYFTGPRNSKKVPLAGDWRPWGLAEISIKNPSLFGASDPALQIEKTSYKQELLGGILATLPGQVELVHPGDAITLSFDLRGVLYQQHEANKLCVALLNGSQDYRFGYGQTIRADVRILENQPWADFQAFSSFSGNKGKSLGIDKHPEINGFFGLCGVAGQSGNIDHIIRVSFTIRRAANGDLSLLAEQRDTSGKNFLKTSRTVAAGELLNGGNSGSPQTPYTFTEVFLGVYRGATVQVDNIALGEIHGS